MIASLFHNEAQSTRKQAKNHSLTSRNKALVEELLNKYSIYRKDSVSSIHSPRKGQTSISNSPIKHPNWSQLQKPVPCLQIKTNNSNSISISTNSKQKYYESSDSSSDFQTMTMISPATRNTYTSPQDHLTISQLKLLREITEKSKKKLSPKKLPSDYPNLTQVKTTIAQNTPRATGTPQKMSTSLTVKPISPGSENINFFKSPVKYKSPTEETSTNKRSAKSSKTISISSASQLVTPKSPPNKVITSDIIFTSLPVEKTDSITNSVHEEDIVIEKEEIETGSFEEEEVREFFDSPHTPNFIPMQAMSSPTAHHEYRNNNSSSSKSDNDKSDNLICERSEEVSLPMEEHFSNSRFEEEEEESAGSFGSDEEEAIGNVEVLQDDNLESNESKSLSGSEQKLSSDEKHSTENVESIDELSSEPKSKSFSSLESSEMILLESADPKTSSSEGKNDQKKSGFSSNPDQAKDTTNQQNEELGKDNPDHIKEIEEEEDSAPYFGARILSSSEGSPIKHESSEMDTSELERFMAEKHDSLAYDSEDDTIEDGVTFGQSIEKETCDVKLVNEFEEDEKSSEDQKEQIKHLLVDGNIEGYENEEEDLTRNDGSDVASAGSAHEYTEEVMISDSYGSDPGDAIPSPPRAEQILSNRDDKVPDFLGSDSGSLEEEEELFINDYDEVDDFDTGSPNTSEVRDIDDLNRCQRFDFAVGSDYSGEEFSYGDSFSVEPPSNQAKKYLNQAINSDKPIKILLNIGCKITEEQREKSLM